jgi:protein-S-isoprenylcysteine O-methyltransferase Ste14
VAGSGDPRVNLVWRQLTTLARLGALGHFNLDVVSVSEIHAGHAKATRCNLFDGTATGWVEQAILVGFYGSWVALLYSLYCTGLGYQTGLTQWWYWFRQTPAPKREFVTRGAFRYMRHPVYMSFLGLIWFTPVMTLDHAILTVVWTAYIYAGSYFKDRRLLKFIGEPYYEYGKRIWGLPIIGFGSLRFFR